MAYISRYTQSCKYLAIYLYERRSLYMSISKKGNEISPAEVPDKKILPIPFNIAAKQGILVNITRNILIKEEEMSYFDGYQNPKKNYFHLPKKISGITKVYDHQRTIKHVIYL